MVNDEPTSSKKIKVVDRRWFDESGELRKERPSAPKDEVDPAPQGRREPSPPAGGTGAGGPAAKPPREAFSRADGGGPGRVERPSGAQFTMIVDLLAQQAVVLLTGAQGIEKNRDQARLFIDLLDVLQEKTRGRLSDEESAYLRDVLAQLQLAFVESGP